jgi:parvulin-like peptidyl-prolyl isomerase
MIRRTWLAACCAVLAAAGMSHAWGEPPDPYDDASARPAAVVNNQPITNEEVEAELRNAPPAFAPGESSARVRRMEALGLLIDRVLMRQFLERNTQPVSQETLARRLSDLEAGLAADSKTLAQVCVETGQTPDQLKAGLVEQMRWSAFAAGRLTEEALRKYYEDNRGHFDRATVRASHIVLRVPQKAGPAERERIRARLAELKAYLDADPNADFAELARRQSQDSHAARGGDLGYFPRKWAFDEAFSRAAFLLPVGRVSGVVETPYGFHLIKVIDRKDGEPTTYESVRESVRALASEELRQEVLAGQRKEAAKTITIHLPGAGY